MGRSEVREDSGHVLGVDHGGRSIRLVHARAVHPEEDLPLLVHHAVGKHELLRVAGPAERADVVVEVAPRVDRVAAEARRAHVQAVGRGHANNGLQLFDPRLAEHRVPGGR